MIQLTRLNDTKLVINADMIEFVEATPDTVISLLSGKKIMVTEPVEQVVDAIVDYKRRSHQPLISTVG